jgi:hypothetical protein
MCKNFPNELVEAWRSYSSAAREKILELVPDAVLDGLDIDPLDYVGAMLARPTKKLTRPEQRRLVDALEDIEEFAYQWEKRFTPIQIGQAWELSGNHLKTAKWYESLFEQVEESWVLEAAIDARIRQRELAERPEAVQRIDAIIEKLRRKLSGFTGT